MCGGGETGIGGKGSRGLGEGIIQEYVRDDVIQVCRGGRGGWRTSFLCSMPRTEDFKTMLHSMYTT